jgi:transposase
MDSHWVNDRPGYRCRHGHASARLSRGERPKTLYLREDKLLARIAARLADQGDLAGPDPGDVVAYLRAHDVTVVCDADTLALKRNVRAMQ